MIATLFKRPLLVAIAVIAATLAAIAVYHVITVRSGYLDHRSNLAAAETLGMSPATIPAEWLVSGSPVFRSNTFGRSHDKTTSSGLWECVGPGQFVWHYGTDESIYVLEGSAEIEYLGKKFTLKAGESTHFIAGTKANWKVQERIKKTWTLYEPGRLTRLMRRLVG